MTYYNNNTDLFILSSIFLSKRLFSKYYYMTKGKGETPNEKYHSAIIFMMLVLAVWFIMLLFKVVVNSSLECGLLLIYPLITYFLMLKFTHRNYVKCKHSRWIKLQENEKSNCECAPYEVLQIIKSCVFHSGEYIWFWVLLTLGLLENDELYVNSYQTIVSGVSVGGNSFFLLATFYLSKHARELKSAAHYFGNWIKISSQEAYGLRQINTNSRYNRGAVIEYEGCLYKGTSEMNNIHNKPNETLTWLLYILFYNPGRTYIMLLVCQTVLCVGQLMYWCVRTQFLFPTIQAGLSVFVLWYMCGKKIF